MSLEKYKGTLNSSNLPKIKPANFDGSFIVVLISEHYSARHKIDELIYTSDIIYNLNTTNH